MSFVKANIAYAYYNAVFYQRIRREGGGGETDRERERDVTNTFSPSYIHISLFVRAPEVKKKTHTKTHTPEVHPVFGDKMTCVTVPSYQYKCV